MPHLQAQYKIQKVALPIVLLVMFLFQSAVAAAESGPLDLLSLDTVNQSCVHNCIDQPYEGSDLSQTLLGEEGNAFCDDCEYCSGCHLISTVHNLTVHAVSGSLSCLVPLSLLTDLRPTDIDRPPIV